MDVKATIEVINNMSNTLKNYADNLEEIAINMTTTEDLSYSGEALNTIRNCFNNLRIDLLVTRPIREYERLINKDIKK